MPATIRELLQDKPTPITTRSGEPISDALARMIKHGYSQLPVVDEGNVPIAIITADSILRALSNFELNPKQLRVLDAMNERYSKRYGDDELLDYLDEIQREPAIFVVDPQTGILVGILTSNDTTEYFRRRAQDIMLVQDIEETIKDCILAAFSGPDDPLLSDAIAEITPSNKDELRPAFGKALKRYFELGAGNTVIDQKIAQAAFDECLLKKERVKPFDKLTLHDYIEMLVSKSRWEQYQKAFCLDQKALKLLLTSVRTTRNDLAHFRMDITEDQREKLRFCKNWLTLHVDDVIAVFKVPPPAGEPAPEPEHTAQAAPSTASAEPAPDEDTPLTESRYEQISIWLDKQPAETVNVSVSFDEIEQIIGSNLPASAREYRSWWSNIPKGHTQSRQWLDAGWRVASVSLLKNSIVFVRNDKLGDAYRTFFEKLQAIVREASPPFLVKSVPPQGYHWMTVGQLPDHGRRVAFLNFSFTRTRQFRVELYIDTDEKARNKSLFDILYNRRARIEAELGETLVWERIDDKRASRVAIYRPGSVTDEPHQLEVLQTEACSLMLRFARVLKQHVTEALAEPTGPGAS